MSGPRRYQLLSTLGAGGFGTVYQARLLGGGGFTKNVALKLPHPERLADSDIAQRLREEARLLGLVRHRSIVHVDSLVLLNGSWTVVMEYIEGVDLTRALTGGPLPVRVALAIIEEVVSALHVAYTTRGPDGEELRLVHRDVKPSNVLLTAAGEVKVLDFGIARADLDAGEVTTLANAGSRLFMSPERLDGIDDPRADVYSLGAVLFELLTARAFGKTSGHPERHAQRLTVAMAHLRAVLGSGASDVATLVGEMLAYEPKYRPWPRDVERRAGDLGAAIPGPRLRDWAERNVPDLLGARVVSDPLQNVILAEQTEEEAARTDPMAWVQPLAPLELLPDSALDVLGEEVEPVDRKTRPAFEEATKDDTTTVQFISPEQELVLDTATGAPPRVDHVLMDSTGTPAPAERQKPPAAPLTAGAFVPVLAIGVGGGSLLGIVALAVAWFIGRPDEPVVVEPEPVEQVAVAPEPIVEPAPEPVVEPDPEPVPEPTTVAEPAPRPAPRTRPRPRPAPAPVVTAEPAPKRTRVVAAAGDAEDVTLVGAQRYVLPADVPPGEYGIEATFGRRKQVGAGRLVVGDEPITLTCKALFLRCSAE